MRITDRDILFEDNHVIAINKQTSDIVQGDKTGDIPVSEYVKAYLKEKYKKPGNVFLGLVHRIDRPVSGALLFAKTGKSLTRLNEMLKHGEITKIYWAVVRNMPPDVSGHLVHYLRRNEKINKTLVFDREKMNTTRAELKYELIGKSDTYYLLEVELITGRHHQIRAQLSHIGCPVKGDLKYGFPRTNQDASIHLHSRKLRFIHPVKKEPVVIIADPPADPVWDYFIKTQAGHL